MNYGNYIEFGMAFLGLFFVTVVQTTPSCSNIIASGMYFGCGFSLIGVQ